MNDYLHAPLAPTERSLLQRLLDALEPVEPHGDDVLLASVTWPEYVDGVSNLAHKIVDLTDARALVLLVEMDERVFAVVQEQNGADRRGRDRRRARRWRPRAGGLGDLA